MIKNCSIIEELEQILKVLDEAQLSLAAVKIAEAIDILASEQSQDDFSNALTNQS